VEERTREREGEKGKREGEGDGRREEGRKGGELNFDEIELERAKTRL